MSEPGSVLNETVRLLGALRRRLEGGGTPRNPRPAPDDVWGRATWEEPGHHIATGAPECQYCPICRAIAAAREARGASAPRAGRGPVPGSVSGLAGQVSNAGRTVTGLLGDLLSFGDTPPTGVPEPTPTGFSAPRSGTVSRSGETNVAEAGGSEGSTQDGGVSGAEKNDSGHENSDDVG
jgi:hypothetical protein